MQQKVHCLCEAMHLHQWLLLDRCSVGTAGLPKRVRTYIEKIRHTNCVQPQEHSILTIHKIRNYEDTPVQEENS